MPYPTKTSSAWSSFTRSTSAPGATMSSISFPPRVESWRTPFGPLTSTVGGTAAVSFTSGACWNHEAGLPPSPGRPGCKPAASSCAARYFTASSSPRSPGARPSSRSSERKRRWPEISSALTRAAAACSAGVRVGAAAAGSAARTSAAASAERCEALRIMGAGSYPPPPRPATTTSHAREPVDEPRHIVQVEPQVPSRPIPGPLQGGEDEPQAVARDADAQLGAEPRSARALRPPGPAPARREAHRRREQAGPVHDQRGAERQARTVHEVRRDVVPELQRQARMEIEHRLPPGPRQLGRAHTGGQAVRQHRGDEPRRRRAHLVEPGQGGRIVHAGPAVAAAHEELRPGPCDAPVAGRPLQVEPAVGEPDEALVCPGLRPVDELTPVAAPP